MKQEIERKFLVTDDSWRATAGPGKVCCQGYITSGPTGATVRVRLLGGQGFLTIKGPAQNISRPEYEYEISAADAEYMIENLCEDRLISKKRYTLKDRGMTWEIDEFSGLNEGLIVAEIELESEIQPFERPEWLGNEVTFDSRYTNAVLARNPFSGW
jgi:CYTH domain-containing protein